MPTWKVELIPEAHADFNGLDGSVKKPVLKQLVKLEQNSTEKNSVNEINLSLVQQSRSNRKLQPGFKI